MQSEGEIAPQAAAPVRVFSCGNAVSRVTLHVEGEILRIEVAGDALDEGIVGCFQDALAQGVIRPNMLVLVDLSDFAGRFEWSTIHAIVELAPWGSEPGRASRVAYVTKSAWFSAMMKVTSILFPRTQHRQFSSALRALQWLQSQRSH
ncbi:STAS/SEC14 domain-containing protein [Dongia sp.]|uniref:STAS/SEC14 domain-containing protein n=1 Tax=Dongia sp. TaxID=1977262 RepID=UPI003751B44B